MISPYFPSPNEDCFRSSGEAQIGRLFDRYGILYQYEPPVAVVDRGKVRIWYPDFQLVDQGILLEYCGRLGDAAYAQGVEHKRATYEANGLTALMFTPETFKGNWSSRVLDGIDTALAERLEAFRRARSPGRPEGRRAPR